MTDLEAVAEVKDSLGWCYPVGRYFDTDKSGGHLNHTGSFNVLEQTHPDSFIAALNAEFTESAV